MVPTVANDLMTQRPKEKKLLLVFSADLYAEPGKVPVQYRKHDKTTALLTFVGLAVAVGSCGWGAIASFNFERVGSLLLTIEHNFGEDLACLFADLEVVFALIARRIHDSVVNLQFKSFID